MDKSTLRINIKQRIAQLEKTYIAESNREILKKLLLLPEYSTAPRIFSYFSIGREVDTKLFITHCLESGRQVALPTRLSAGSMSFALLEQPLESLPIGRYGIPAPDESSKIIVPREGDLIIVPALSYDLSCYRIGRGGGYYDRFLASCKAFSVGLCREALLVQRVPTEGFDLPTDCLITEKRIARPVKAPQR